MICRWATALVALACLVGCGDDSFSREPIRVGVIVDRTLAPAISATQTKAAFVVEREVNAAGGLLGGRPVELTVEDARGMTEVAERISQSLIDEGAVGIIGPLSSGAMLAIADIGMTNQVPFISASATASEITDAQPETARYLFRTAPSDLLQAQVLANHLVTLACARIAVLNEDTPYGNSLAARVVAQAGGPLGLTVVSPEGGDSVKFATGRASYSDEVRDVAALNPDCVVLVTLAADGGTVVRDWESLPDEPDVTWIGTDGLKSAEFARNAGSAAILEGFLGTAPITAPDTPTNNDFVETYGALFADEVPGIFGTNQYDAVALLMLAIERAGTTDGSTVRDALFEVSRGDSDVVVPAISLSQGLIELREGVDINYNGASGPVDFNNFGDVVSDYEIWRYDATSEEFLEVARIRAEDI